ncbi:MAG: hypothetical protein M0R80_01620 [Proteobacteria bacterium]|jgi:hypothetical protein|nr:hypothetical protein [Pseudomonadota bacterium]
MKISFRQFVEQNVPGTHNDGPGGAFNLGTGGAFITSDQSGSETQSNLTPVLPAYELTTQVVPHTKFTGKIAQIKEYQDPYKTQVQIRVEQKIQRKTADGKLVNVVKSETILINTDQYRTMQIMNGGKKPKEGDVAIITLLRLPNDQKSQATVMGMRY